jgi:long-chain acyl-CoA synthetase
LRELTISNVLFFKPIDGSKVDQCRTVLHDLGVKQGSKVAIISNNRWEWAVITAAAYSLQATAVPMYEAQLPADWTYILNDSEAMLLFVANDSILATVRREVLANVPGLKAAFSMDAVEGQTHAFATVMAAQEPDEAGRYLNAPSPDDLANLIYTSGTTGKPKGVELTHANFTSNVKAAARTMVVDPRDFIRHDDCSLAFLPWAHSYGQTCELWMSMSHGASMGISRGIPAILEDLQLVKPTVLFSVPTLYKKIYDGVHNLIINSSPIRKRLMQSALAIGHERVMADRGQRSSLGLFERAQYKLLDSLVLSKIRGRFGGRMRHGFVAGAACPSEVLNFMDAIGIPVCEGYGLTETSPIITINTPEQRHVGSVGRPIGGVSVHICNENGEELPRGQEGEICCVGPNVMRGYYKNDAATKEVLSSPPSTSSYGSEQLMFHTGDLGRQDESGFVFVTGRLKEQYKLENGYVVDRLPLHILCDMNTDILFLTLTFANTVESMSYQPQ